MTGGLPSLGRDALMFGIEARIEDRQVITAVLARVCGLLACGKAEPAVDDARLARAAGDGDQVEPGMVWRRPGSIQCKGPHDGKGNDG